MGRTVRANKTCAVHRKADRQVLQRHIMHHLVITALEEGRVNRAKRLIAIRRKTACKGDSMLFGNPDIEHAFREDLAKFLHARPARHRRSDTDDFIILARFRNQTFGEDFRIGRRIGFRLGLHACDDVKFRHAVIFIG